MLGARWWLPLQPRWSWTWADGPCGAPGLGAGLGAGTQCRVQMCPDVGEPLTDTSCLLAVGPAEVGGKVRATCRYQVWVFWHLWAAAQRWGTLTLGKSSSSTQMQVGLPLFSCQGLQELSSCGALPAPGAQFGLQPGSSARDQGISPYLTHATDRTLHPPPYEHKLATRNFIFFFLLQLGLEQAEGKPQSVHHARTPHASCQEQHALLSWCGPVTQ